MSRLQKKFFGYFIVLGIVPVVVISIITIFTTYFLHKRDIRLIEENLINQKSAEISKFFESAVSQIQVIVGYDNYAQPKISNQNFLLEGIIKANQNGRRVSFVCAVKKDCKIGIETAVLSADNIKTKLKDRSNDESFQKAINREIYFSDIEFDGDLPIIEIASSVKNKNNQTIGVLIFELDLTPIKEIIKNSILGETGYVYLIDNKNQIIAYSIETQKFFPKDAKDVISSFKNIDNFNWKIIAEWPKEEAYELIGDIVMKTFLIIIIVIVFVFLLSYFVAGGVLSPLKELIRGSKIVGEGNLDYKINVKADDEIQDLINQFNKMTEELKGIENLTRALEKEKELSAVKGKLLTTISHQLNTPVSRIGWVTETLEKNIDNKEALEEATVVIKASYKNIAAIIQDALFIAEIGSAKYWNKEKINISEIINGILKKFENRISEKDIYVDFDFSGNTEIEANKTGMEKLFENLIDNAIIYNKQGGNITIKIQEKNDKQENGILISIKDTGIGIPQDEQVYIFREIIRAKNAVVGENVGTGMGLFIARMITEGHKGKIWFSSESESAFGGESQENAGSTFFVQLPTQ